MTPLASALALDGSTRWHPVTRLLGPSPSSTQSPQPGSCPARAPPSPGPRPAVPRSPGPLAAGDACAVRPRGGRCPGAVVPAASAMAEEVSTLMKATVLMRQPGRVQEIVGALRRGGGDRLQVISDFDMTLSRFAYNGKRCPSSYNILDNSKIISEECQNELKALLHHYYPIEIDPHRTIKEKLPHMVEWWTKAHDLLCQQRIQKVQIAQVVRESNAMLREGYKTFFNTLYQNNIPLFIFSAGIGDILEEIIRQMKVFHPNIHIVSNYMDFDEDGFLQGFKGQLIHTYNKNSSVCENSGYFQQLQGKTNILLLGDSMGDLTMADGVPGVENILKIGFLNDKVACGQPLLPGHQLHFKEQHRTARDTPGCREREEKRRKASPLGPGLRGRGQNLDFHRISRVVEVNDVDVKDQHSGARDLVSWGQNGEWIGLESRRGCSGLHRGP
uniref:5'-nucleotidase n=1 Tax=Ailuropoda melanoleuca TaxID=9646 RepID=A0A7N5JJE4_AILME